MYNNDQDILELFDQTNAAKPRPHLDQQQRFVRKLIRNERANVQKIKHKLKDMKTKDGEVESEASRLERELQEQQLHVLENEKASLGSIIGSISQPETNVSERMKHEEAPPLQNSALKESTQKYHQYKDLNGSGTD